MTHLERVDTGAVHVYGDLVTPSGRRHPITLPPQDWEALEAALAVAATTRVDGQWCECDAMRPVVEAARALLELRTQPRSSASRMATLWEQLAAAVDALDGAS